MSSCRDVSQTQQFEQWGKDRQYEVESKELVLDVSLALHPGQSAADRSKVIPMLHVHSMHIQHVYTYFYIRTCTRLHVQHVYTYFYIRTCTRMHVQHVYMYFYIHTNTCMHVVHTVLVYIHSKMLVPKAL